MGKEHEWHAHSVDLDWLASNIMQFLLENHFEASRFSNFCKEQQYTCICEKPQHITWHIIRAKKTGVLRTIFSSRKSIIVIIRGTPGQFTTTVDTGEWGKNLAIATFLTGFGYIGLLLNYRFENRLWTFVKNSVGSLKNSHMQQNNNDNNNLAAASENRGKKDDDDSATSNDDKKEDNSAVGDDKKDDDDSAAKNNKSNGTNQQ